MFNLQKQRFILNLLKIFSLVCLVFNLFLFTNLSIFAQTKESYEHSRVKILEVLEEKPTQTLGGQALSQRLKGVILSGSQKGKEIELEYNIINPKRTEFKVKIGDELIVHESFRGQEKVYNVVGFYRLNNLLIILFLFLGVAILVVGFKGFSSLLGLLISIFLIAFWLIPGILNGQSAFWLSLLVAVVLSIINLYLAHGFNSRVTISLISILIVIILTAILAPLLTNFLALFGVASEEAFYLQAWEGGKLDLKGIFLGGMLIGTLGVLDDVATAQAATVWQVFKANPSLNWQELYFSGLEVGKEHIVSMINTLALAYVGVSLPTILSFVIVQGQPWWVILSSDMIIEEVVRTFVGSFALILTIPICNLLAALWFSRSLKDKFKQRI